MKYLCKNCKTACKDIIQHIRKVHNISDATIKSDLEKNPNTYKNAFEEIKQVINYKNYSKIILGD